MEEEQKIQNLGQGDSVRSRVEDEGSLSGVSKAQVPQKGQEVTKSNDSIVEKAKELLRSLSSKDLQKLKTEGALAIQPKYWTKRISEAEELQKIGATLFIVTAKRDKLGRAIPHTKRYGFLENEEEIDKLKENPQPPYHFEVVMLAREAEKEGN